MGRSARGACDRQVFVRGPLGLICMAVWGLLGHGVGHAEFDKWREWARCAAKDTPRTWQFR